MVTVKLQLNGFLGTEVRWQWYSLLRAWDRCPPAFHSNVALRSLDNMRTRRSYLRMSMGKSPRRSELERPHKYIVNTLVGIPRRFGERFSRSGLPETCSSQ